MKSFHVVSHLEDIQGIFRFPTLFIVLVVLRLEISAWFRYTLAAMLVLFWLLTQFDRHYIFTKESVEMYSCFHEDEVENNATVELLMKISPPRPVRQIRCRNLPRKALQGVTLHSTKLWGLLVIELVGCQPRYEKRTWQFLLHNRKNVLLILTEFPIAVRYCDLIEAYITEPFEAQTAI